MQNSNDKTLEHHTRQEYCYTRLQYRRGRQLKSVKVYTVANESSHLLVFGVPRINLKQEVKRSFRRFGTLSFVECVTEELAKKVDLEAFTDVYHVKFKQINSARRAKRYLDAQEYYGGILHISYAPERESINELRQKFQQRKSDVYRRVNVNAKNELKITETVSK